MKVLQPSAPQTFIGLLLGWASNPSSPRALWLTLVPGLTQIFGTTGPDQSSVLLPLSFYHCGPAVIYLLETLLIPLVN